MSGRLRPLVQPCHHKRQNGKRYDAVDAWVIRRERASSFAAIRQSPPPDRTSSLNSAEASDRMPGMDSAPISRSISSRSERRSGPERRERRSSRPNGSGRADGAEARAPSVQRDSDADGRFRTNRPASSKGLGDGYIVRPQGGTPWKSPWLAILTMRIAAFTTNAAHWRGLLAGCLALTFILAIRGTVPGHGEEGVYDPG